MASGASLCLRELLRIGFAALLTVSDARAGQALLREVEPDNIPASAMSLGLATAGGVVQGQIAQTGDVDYYSFAASANDRVFAATMTSFADQGQFDSLLQVIGPDGVTVIATDNNQGSFGAAASSIAGATLPTAGTYFLRVSGSGSSTQIRPYHLHFQLRHGSPTPETEPSVSSPLPASGWVSGVFSSGDTDRFSLSLNAGDSVFLSLDLDPERDSVAWNGGVGLRPLQNATLSTPNEADATNPRSQAFFMTVKNTGTYEVVVSTAAGSATSTYVLSATVHPNTPASASCTTYSSSDVPKAIPDALPDTTPGRVTSVITVPGHPRIEDLDVSVSLNHARMDNLDVQLLSPAGNNNGLFSDIGAGAGATADQQVMDLLFDDEAALPAAFNIVSGVAFLPSHGSLTQRNYPLLWFDGEDAGGTWTLDIRDDAFGSVGTLLGWSITVCEPPPPAACPAGLEPNTRFQSDFELSDSSFVASGTPAVGWQWGTPNFSPVFPPFPPNGPCNNDSLKCWKTNLSGTYAPNANQDLLSPPINLTGLAAPVTLTWAQKYQMGTAQSDHAYVEVTDGSGGNARRVFEHLEPEMVSIVTSPSIDASAGWGVRRADVSSYAGQSMKVRFHLDSGPTLEYAGFAIDDVTVTGCAPIPIPALRGPALAVLAALLALAGALSGRRRSH